MIYVMDFNRRGIQNLWHFDGDTKDSMGEQDGVNIGGLTYVAGKFDRGLNCVANTSQYIDCGTVTSRSVEELSISAWVQWKGTATGDILVNSFDNTTAYTTWSISVFNSGGTYRGQCRFGGFIEITGSTVSLATNGWYLITMVFNSTDVRLYVNTTLEGTAASIGSLLYDNSYNTIIGNSAPSAGTKRPFQGVINQVAIWNYALTPTDIANIYNSGTGIRNPEHDILGSMEMSQIGVSNIYANALGIDGNSDRTTSMWVNVHNFDIDKSVVFDIGSYSDYENWGLRALTSSTWRVQCFGGGDVDFTYTPVDDWVFFVLTYDGTNVRAYADGGIVTTQARALNTTFDEPLTFASWRGFSQSGTGKLTLSDFRIYDRVLVGAEIETMFHSKGRDKIVRNLQGRWFTTEYPVTRWGVDTTPALLGPWEFASTHVNPAPAGNHRMMVLCVSWHSNGTHYASSVTYGGQSFILGYRFASVSGSTVGSEIWYMLEDSVAAANTNVITVSFGISPAFGTDYTHAIFSNVNQYTPISDTTNETSANGSLMSYEYFANNKNSVVISNSVSGTAAAGNWSVSVGPHTMGIALSSTNLKTGTAYYITPDMSGPLTTTIANNYTICGVSCVFENYVEPLRDVSNQNSGQDIESTFRPRASYGPLRQ